MERTMLEIFALGFETLEESVGTQKKTYSKKDFSNGGELEKFATLTMEMFERMRASAICFR